jgi:hypothetical protein
MPGALSLDRPSITASSRFASSWAAWLVVPLILKFAKAMQQFALHGVDFSCNLLDQKLRALAQLEAPCVTSFVDRLSDAHWIALSDAHWIAGSRKPVCVFGRAGH